MNLAGSIKLNKTGIVILALITLFLIYAYTSKSQGPDEKLIDLRELLITAIRAARNGGHEVVSVKDNLKIESKGKTKEGLNDSVTTADYRSHCSMTSTIKHFFPSVKVISEEAKTQCSSDIKADFSEEFAADIYRLVPEVFSKENDVTVWIDPLDATKEYTEKLYQYVTTMVCIAVKGKATIGVIFKPFSKETFWGWAEKGYSENIVPKTSKDNHLKIIVSLSHTGKLQEILKTNFPTATIELAAGAGYKTLEVANGKSDAYIHSTAIKKWDLCAGNAILNSIGGKMTTKDNELIDYSDTTNVVNTNGVVATYKNHELFLHKF